MLNAEKELEKWYRFIKTVIKAERIELRTIAKI